MSEVELMAEHFVIIGQGRLIADVSAGELREMAAGDRTVVQADALGDLRRDAGPGVANLENEARRCATGANRDQAVFRRELDRI